MSHTHAHTIPLIIDHIVKTPGIVGGKPRIDGTRVSVPFIVDLYIRQHVSAEQIASEYDLTPAQVYAAIAYYYDHQEEINGFLSAEDELEVQLVDTHRQAEIDALAEAKLQQYLAQRQEMTVTEVAEAYGLTTRAVRKAVENASLIARKSGSTWLIARRDAEARWGKKGS